MPIWYAAYGSNLLRDRFLTYLRGGPVPGAPPGRDQHGARDPSDPLDDRPHRLAPELLFARSSSGWGGGGVCFVDPAVEDPAGTLGRAWLITVEQLADVWAQENGGTVGPEVSVDRLRTDGGLDLDGGWYQRLLYLGELDGHPVATITCHAAPTSTNAAGHAYLAVMAAGLRETWDLSVDEAAAYLAGRRGNAELVDPGELADVCRRSPLR